MRIVRKVFHAFLWSLGLLMVLVTVLPLTSWWGYRLAGTWPAAPSGDVLVVLAADSPNGGVIGQGTYWRAVYAVRTWHIGHFSKMVISGGNGSADTLRDFVVCHGIPADAIVLEDRSGSTRENALFTAELLRNMPGKKTLLTSDYHMYRALAVYRKLGLTLEPLPFPEAIKHSNNWWHRWSVFMQLLDESAKIAGYKFKGWI